MLYFSASNINDMALQVYPHLEKYGVVDDSRNGRVKKFPGLVCLEYRSPLNRACFIDGRDANPFFHIAEAMWMLAGRRDVEFLDIFNSNMKNYSDDGVVFNAAYGYRLRHHFGFDQLDRVVNVLSKDPLSRQAVCQLWDANDLGKDTKDKACNMSMVFTMPDDEHIDLVIYNRSNDAVYGNITGANPIHFSYFLQYVANRLEVQVGKLTFVTTNLHVYLDLYPHWEKLKDPSLSLEPVNPKHDTLFDLEEAEYICDTISRKTLIDIDFISSHLNNVVKPILNTWMSRKYDLGNYSTHLAQIQDEDLRIACANWIIRRMK